MKKQKKLVAGNWKMNPLTLDEAKTIASEAKKVSGKLMIKKAQIRYRKANSKHDSSINVLNGKYGSTAQRRALGYK